MTDAEMNALDRWLAERLGLGACDAWVCWVGGRENDVMGPGDPKPWRRLCSHGPEKCFPAPCPPEFSRDLNAAHLLGERLRELGLHVEYMMQIWRQFGYRHPTVCYSSTVTKGVGRLLDASALDRALAAKAVLEENHDRG